MRFGCVGRNSDHVEVMRMLDALRGRASVVRSAGDLTLRDLPIGYADLPPSTATICPVIKEDFADEANTMACAISSGFPRRLSGTLATRPAFLSALPVNRSSIPVSTGPGATAFTRTPN